MNSTESKIVMFVIALLVSVISGLVVGYLSYDGNVRKATLCGLGAFGGTLVAAIAIEANLGLP